MAPRKKASDETETKAKKSTKNSSKIAKPAKSAPVKGTKKEKLRESIAAEPVTVKAKSNKKPNVFISFEVCKSCHTYKRQAAKVFDDLSALFPDKSFEMSINEFGPPRRGAFEITVSKKKGNSSDANLLWSGLKKGPPRRLKFPEADVLSDNMAKILS